MRTRSADWESDLPVEYLDIDDLIGIARGLLGDPPPIRDLGLLGSAAARPRASAFGEDAYPDLWSKAAAFLHSIVKNHPLVDGNKRLGWMACAVFLEINGAPAATATNDEVFRLVMDVAGGDLDLAEVKRRIQTMLER